MMSLMVQGSNEYSDCFLAPGFIKQQVFHGLKSQPEIDSRQLTGSAQIVYNTVIEFKMQMFIPGIGVSMQKRASTDNIQ